MASGARITHIKGGFAESQHGFGQNIEFTASRPRCYYLVQITDAGSVPCSTTKNTQTKNPYEMVYRKGFLFFCS